MTQRNANLVGARDCAALNRALDTQITFGQHDGLTLGQVARLDHGVRWLEWASRRRADAAREIADAAGVILEFMEPAT